MSDHLDRAAEVIYVEVLGLPAYSPDAVADHNRHSYRGDCQCNAYDRFVARHAAEDLDAAGLLVTPERDAAVAAKAWDEGYSYMRAACEGSRRAAEMAASGRLRSTTPRRTVTSGPPGCWTRPPTAPGRRSCREPWRL